MKDCIKLPLVLVIISIISAVSLAFVYEKTEPIIQDNKMKELRAVQQEFFPEACNFEEVDVPAEIADAREGIKQFFKAFDSEGKEQGSIIVAEGTGYGGTIKLAVGVKDKSIIGVKILSHLETPGLGSRIEGNDFLSQFTGKPDVKEVDAITGATISSSSVIRSVAKSLEYNNEAN